MDESGLASRSGQNSGHNLILKKYNYIHHNHLH